MKSTRCEEVLIHLVIRTYDDAGRPVREVIAPPSSPVKVFRNNETRDFWAYVDGQVKAIEGQMVAKEKPEPPAAKPAKFPKLAKGKK